MKLNVFGNLFKSNTKVIDEIIPNPMEKIESHASVEVQKDESNKYDASTIIGGINWYKEQYYKAMKLVLCLGASLGLSLCIIGVLLFNSPSPVYYAATPDLRLAPLIPLDRPVLTQQGLLNWVSETVTNAVSLDFLEWRDKLTKVREHFDSAAFKSFMQALESSGMLAMVKEKRLSISAVVTEAPVIVTSGLINGKATWKIEFPMVISYESSQGVETTQNLIASVLVRRASTITTPRGVVIQQIILKRDS